MTEYSYICCLNETVTINKRENRMKKLFLMSTLLLMA